MAPCGLYCGVCGILMATRDNNEKFKERLAGVYHLKPEEIFCEGCLSEKPFIFCQSCAIKSCTRERGYQGCHQCSDFPCQAIDSFHPVRNKPAPGKAAALSQVVSLQVVDSPMPVGKKVILRTIPAWRELGTEKWVDLEEKRYLCPECGYPLVPRGQEKSDQGCHRWMRISPDGLGDSFNARGAMIGRVLRAIPACTGMRQGKYPGAMNPRPIVGASVVIYSMMRVQSPSSRMRVAGGKALRLPAECGYPSFGGAETVPASWTATGRVE